MLILIKTAERLYRILYTLHHLTFRTKSWCPRELFSLLFQVFMTSRVKFRLFLYLYLYYNIITYNMMNKKNYMNIRGLFWNL